MGNIEDIVALNIRRLREAQGLSQKDLANLAKIHPITLNRVENGKQAAGRDVVYSIAEALRISPHVIYNDPTKVQLLIHSPTLLDVLLLLNAYQDAAPERRKLALRLLTKAMKASAEKKLKDGVND